MRRRKGTKTYCTHLDTPQFVSVPWGRVLYQVNKMIFKYPSFLREGDV